MTDEPVKMRRRIDFVMEPQVIDAKKGIVGVSLVPNPKRYDWVTGKDGKKYLHDKFDDYLMPEDLLQDLAKSMEGQPIFYQPPEIEDADKYVESRKPHVSKLIESGQTDIQFKDKSEEYLESLAVDNLGFAIMSIDLVGSTKLVQELGEEGYTRTIQTLLYEMSNVIPKFKGQVLKYTGDGLIAYFPEPNFITKCDLALDCALTIRRLVYNGLNPLLEQHGLKKVNIRIGLDAGSASVIIVGSPETKQHKDIIGSVINIAAKIQAKATPGGILIGDEMQRNLHTDWKLHCKKFPIEPWPYKDKQGKPYPVFRYEDEESR